MNIQCDVKTAALILGYQERWVQRLCQRGQLPHERDPITGQYWIDKATVDRIAAMRGKSNQSA